MSQEFSIYTDGGSRGNPGKAASAAVIYDAAGKMRFICGKYLGVATNNIAEYTAVEIALERLRSELEDEAKNTQLRFFTDSNLVASQLSGKFKVKNPEIAKKVIQIRNQEKNFQIVSYQHIPREKNFAADREVNRILDQN